MMQARCPICSAPSFGCDHEGLRWSLVAGEYEESPLAHDAVLLGQAVEALLKDCWVRRRPPCDRLLIPSYEEGLALIDDEFTADEALSEVSFDGDGYALDFVERLPGVIVQFEGDGDWQGNGGDSTQVFWTKDLDAVRDAVADRIRAFEVEMARD
ncbi:MAG: hypothetical protein AB7O38_19400 [Pirellulaceae bacterium]